jgi:DNA repair protein RecN (Recombination protein N)
LDIDFQNGFSVMTGETCAGKSIILGALNLVMGARADLKAITEGEERCIIEATFSSPQEIIIRRELTANGRSRSFVNDEVVTQVELKALARELIDIHSQHESLMIGDDLFQIQVVDAIAGNNAEYQEYSQAYQSYLQAMTALREAQDLAKKAQADADYMQWQYNQLAEAQLMAGEMEEL